MIVVHHAAEPEDRPDLGEGERVQPCAGCGMRLDGYAFEETGIAFFPPGSRVALRYADSKAFVAGRIPLGVFELPAGRPLVGDEIYCVRLARMMQR